MMLSSMIGGYVVQGPSGLPHVKPTPRLLSHFSYSYKFILTWMIFEPQILLRLYFSVEKNTLIVDFSSRKYELVVVSVSGQCVTHYVRIRGISLPFSIRTSVLSTRGPGALRKAITGGLSRTRS